MRSGNPQSIRSLLSESLKALDLQTRVKEHACVMAWDEVVGEQVAAAAQPQFVRDGRLFVITKSPVWANELTMYKKDMIARLNRRVGSQAIKDIVFQAGKLSPRQKLRREEPPPEISLEGIQLSDEELETVEAAVSHTSEDAGVALKDLLLTAARMEKWKKTQGWKPCSKCGVLQNASTGICPPCEITSG